jgi:hypothetical protein
MSGKQSNSLKSATFFHFFDEFGSLRGISGGFWPLLALVFLDHPVRRPRDWTVIWIGPADAAGLRSNSVAEAGFLHVA